MEFAIWKGQYPNRKMKSLCNEVIDHFAGENVVCATEGLSGLARKLKFERDFAEANKAAAITKQKADKAAIRARNEQIELCGGYRSEGRGVELNKIDITGLDDDDISVVFDGLGKLG